MSQESIVRIANHQGGEINYLSDGVRVMCMSFFDSPLAELLAYAYDAGLATGYFGKHSAIAEGLRRKLGDVSREAREQLLDRAMRRLIRQAGQFGRQHGAFIECQADVE